MSDSGYVFNPYKNGQLAVQDLSATTLTELDQRYINVGESVFSETIDNLDVQNLNLSTTGKIYFANDMTEQTTAYDPTVTTAQINNFKTTNNNWTGINKFTNVSINDSTDSIQQNYHKLHNQQDI